MMTETDIRTVKSALEDAASYRRDGGPGNCSDCTVNELCENHKTDEAIAGMYDELAGRL